jgi:hypothetical protein
MIEAQKGLAEVSFSYGVRLSKCRPMPYLTVCDRLCQLVLELLSFMTGWSWIDEPWKHCAVVRQIVMAHAAAINASSLPGLWTMKIRL